MRASQGTFSSVLMQVLSPYFPRVEPLFERNQNKTYKCRLFTVYFVVLGIIIHISAHIQVTKIGLQRKILTELAVSL